MKEFTGKELDRETRLDYFGARYLSGDQGRSTSPDCSAKPEPVPCVRPTDPQSLNLYSYVRNNPLPRVDPDGHCGIWGHPSRTFKQWVQPVPQRVVGGLKGEGNAVLYMVRGGDGIGRFQPSNAEQEDAMQAVKQVEPGFQQGLAMANSVPKKSKLSTAGIMSGIEGGSLDSSRDAISGPAVNRYVDKINAGEKAPSIKVDGSFLVDGNHRYVAGLLTDKLLETTPGTASPTQVKSAKPFGRVKVDPKDWGNHL